MATLASSRPAFAASPSRQMRTFMATSSLTLFGLLVLMVFLLPLGYMSLTAFKTLQQIQDPNSQFLPALPTTYNYQGADYPLYQVPVPTESGVVIKEWALFKKGREESDFIDPANPDAGPIHWVGRWRVLDPVYRFSPTLENFPGAWEQVNLGRLFSNTFIIAIAGTIGTLLSSICVGYGFSRFRIPGINAIFLVLIATIILPVQVTFIPQYIFFRAIGWGGTWWPLIIPHFFSNAYNVFLLRQYFKGIPRELDEAATIDGASPFQTLLHVIIPQSVSAITAVGLFHFFWAWNDFFGPLIYLQGREDLYTISVGLTQFTNTFSTQPTYAMAAAMMAIALPVVIFFLTQRVFMQGIVITGVDK
jgi:multiple sugar transport system permease protein